MVDFIIKLNPQFTDADKEACLPVIDRIIELATIARSKGLLALEKEAEKEENIFLQRATMLIVDANDPDKVREMLEHFILADNHSGAELLSRVIILEGVMRVAAGSNPRFIREGLNMILGEKYLTRMEQAQKEKEKEKEPIEQFLKGIKSKERFWLAWDFRYFLRTDKGYTKGLGWVKRLFENLEVGSERTIDFLFELYNHNDCEGQIKTIVDEINSRDLIVIFKSGNCSRETYAEILYNMSKNNQLNLISDVEKTSDFEPIVIEETKARIIEIFNNLDKDGMIGL